MSLSTAADPDIAQNNKEAVTAQWLSVTEYITINVNEFKCKNYFTKVVCKQMWKYWWNAL